MDRVLKKETAKSCVDVDTVWRWCDNVSKAKCSESFPECGQTNIRQLLKQWAKINFGNKEP